MPYKDPARQREYQRQWMAARRAEHFAGKVCEECDSSDELEIHHVDPPKKISHLIWSWAKKRREAELAKCVILCSECHKKKRAADHGAYLYQKGCRCLICKAAHAERLREYWRRRYARSGLV